jgi:alginate O-acetyltransferase complex protein AlgJ
MSAVAILRVGLFVVLLAVPMMTMRGGAGALQQEQRTRAPMPSLRTAGAQFPEQADAYFRDNFGGRDRIIRWHHQFKYEVFGESPVDGVIAGRDGWLFYSVPSDGMDIRNFSGHWPHQPSDVERWLTAQEGRRRQYSRLGARYLVAIAPDKQTVYPELVPFRYGPHAPGVLGELMGELKMFPDLPVLDLTPVLRRAAASGIYYKSDTHWNARGAFLAAGAIVDRLRARLPNVGEVRESDYDVASSARGTGDLVNIMGLGLATDDLQFTYQRREGGAHEVRADALHRVWEQPGSTRPKAVLVGDSFGEALAPILADAFSRLHYYRSSTSAPDLSVVVQEAPDVVILISVERYLPHLASR